jgi:plasmid stabilization system protein ParE
VRLPIKPIPAAAAQIRKESRWWRTNRTKAPGLFRDELRRVFELIAGYPEAGAVSDDPELPGVRRILLPWTQYYLYYRVSEREKKIEVLGLWSTRRGDLPSL